MNVTFPRSSVLAVLKLALGVIDSKSPLPALNNVLLDACGDRLTITATDLYRSVYAEIGEGVSCPHMGRIAIPAKILYQRIEAMPDGPVELATKDEAVTLKSGVRKSLSYKLMGLKAEEYPVVGAPKDDLVWVTVPAGTAQTLLDKTLYSASEDNTRAMINCVYIVTSEDKITAYSTDGHRVSKMAVDVKGIGHLSVQVPKSGAEHLRKVVDEAVAQKLPVEIAVAFPECFFRVGAIRYSVKLASQDPMPYERIFPESHKYNATMPRAALLTSVRNIALSADEKSAQIYFTFAKGELTLSASDATKGESSDTLAIDFTGKPFKVSFHAPYLVDVLTRIDGDEIEFGSDGPPGEREAKLVTMKAAAPVEGSSFVALVGLTFN